MNKKINARSVLIVLVVLSVLFNLVFVLDRAYISMKNKLYNQAYQQVVQGVYNTVKAKGEIEIVYNNEQLKLVLTEENNEEEV